MNYHRRQPRTPEPSHRLNVVTVSRHWPTHGCSRSCSHFELKPYDEDRSFCRLWGAILEWLPVPNCSTWTVPLRCSGCTEDNSLTVEVEQALPGPAGSQPKDSGK